jgi:2-haloacid dehalogenase
MHRILAAHGKDTDDATILQLYGDFEARAEKGPYRCYREVLQSVARDFGKQLKYAPADEQTRSLPESLRDWRPWPDTVNALHELRKRFSLAIISNVDDDLFAATLPQLEVKFDQIITAQQAGAYKPSLKIFELALSRIGVSAHRILHVGQSIYHDIVPAQSLGLSTVWVNRPSPRAGVGAVKAAEGQPDLTVSSLAQLVSACTRQ